MPLVRIDDDRTRRLIEHDPENFEIPPGRTERYALVEITAFPSRSPGAKRNLYQAIVGNLGDPGIEPEDVSFVLVGPAMENWGIRGGQPASEVALGFRLDV
jgi:hypothetical protein